MSYSAIERRRRAALAMIQRGLHDDELSAARAMDRSQRTYYYIKASKEWLELRNRLDARIRQYAWMEWQAAVARGDYDRAGDICYAFDLIKLRRQMKRPFWVQIDDDWA